MSFYWIFKEIYKFLPNLRKKYEFLSYFLKYTTEFFNNYDFYRI